MLHRPASRRIPAPDAEEPEPEPPPPRPAPHVVTIDKNAPFWSLKFEKLVGQYFRHLFAFFIAFTVLSIAAFVMLSLIGITILEAIN